MPSVLVRDLDRWVVETLKKSARRHDRSLQAELKEILESAARRRNADIWREVDRIRALTAGRPQTDSAELIREDRDR